MTVSIIIPVNNAENTIEKCVDSLLKQTADIQIILIENGYTDNSQIICMKIANKNSNVELYIN